jgi:hypothetical protein
MKLFIFLRESQINPRLLNVLLRSQRWFKTWGSETRVTVVNSGILFQIQTSAFEALGDSIVISVVLSHN